VAFSVAASFIVTIVREGPPERHVVGSHVQTQRVWQRLIKRSKGVNLK
jgi:hypothetical protein